MSRTRRPIQRVDGRMLVRVKHETEQVEILPLPVRMHRLGNDDRAVFDTETRAQELRVWIMIRLMVLERNM